MLYLVRWEDPEENDHAIGAGFEEFESDSEMLLWLNEKSKHCPKLTFQVYNGYRMNVEAVSVVTEFRVKE